MVKVFCERNGIVTDSLIDRGIEACAFDLELGISLYDATIQMDVRQALHIAGPVIAFPPCTYLSSASGGRYSGSDLEKRAGEFAQMIWESADVVCIENPAGSMVKYLGKYQQVIEPWYFGDPYRKRTCLWLKGLPPLISTAYIYPQYSKVMSGRAGDRVRSLFHWGVAGAMACQWEKYLI